MAQAVMVKKGSSPPRVVMVRCMSEKLQPITMMELSTTRLTAFRRGGVGVGVGVGSTSMVTMLLEGEMDDVLLYCFVKVMFRSDMMSLVPACSVR